VRLVLIFLIFLIQVKPAISCACKYPTEINAAYDYANTVAYGEVVQLKIIKVRDSMDQDSLIHYKLNELTGFQLEVLNSDYIVEAKLKIKELFKGDVQEDTLTLYTTRTAGSCGYTRFLIGVDYLVYASSSSYAFYKFQELNRKGRFEKQHTKWVTRCSITEEFDKDHFSKLQKLKQSIEQIRIARKGFSTLRDYNLLKYSNKIYASVFVKGKDNTLKPLEFDDKQIITNIEIGRQDLVLTINPIEAGSVILNFTSIDGDGLKYTGTLKLNKTDGNTWLKDTLEYVIAIK